MTCISLQNVLCKTCYTRLQVILEGESQSRIQELFDTTDSCLSQLHTTNALTTLFPLHFDIFVKKNVPEESVRFTYER